MKIPRRVKRVAVFVIAFVAGLWIVDAMLSTRSIAETTTAPSTQATIEPAAQVVIDRLLATYSNRPVSVEGTLDVDFDVAGMVDQRKSRVVGSAVSATKYSHEIEGEVRIVCDGESVHVLDLKKNVYISNKLDDNVSAKPSDDLVAAMLREQNPAMLLATAGSPQSALFVAAEKVALEVNPDAPSMDVIATTDGSVSRRYFIGKETGTLDRVEIDFASLLSKQGAREIKRAAAVLSYSKTDFKSQPEPALFAFKPPADATEAKDTSRELLTSAGDAEQLAGKPAPSFELKDLEGQSVSLESMKDQVIILDFWATWCGPCVQSLPGLNEIANEYAERGVRVLAINQQEEADAVRAFMAAKGLSLKTLLDADGSAGRKYRVSGIPQTVIIGRDGVVRKVLIGFSPGHSAILREEVEAALK